VLIARLPWKIDPILNPENLCGCKDGKAVITHLFTECVVFKGMRKVISEKWRCIPPWQRVTEAFEGNRKTADEKLMLKVYSTLVQTQWLTYCSCIKENRPMSVRMGLETFCKLAKLEGYTEKEDIVWNDLVLKLKG
jgi:hypothetical protein